MISDARRRRPLRDKGQLEVVDDAVHHGIVGEESDDLHRAPALRTDQRVNLIDLADHLGPALGREEAGLIRQLTWPSFSKERRSRESTGRIMYLPTRSGSVLVLARTRL